MAPADGHAAAAGRGLPLLLSPLPAGVPSPRETLEDRPLLFFGGKGGVGKTTLAAAVAVGSADAGRRTLLVSTDPAHSIGDVLRAALGNDPSVVHPNLWALEIDPGEEADRYIAGVKERIAEVTPPRLAAEVERQIDVARVSPGAEEAALFDRFTRIMGEAGAAYDRVVFDTAPLGHTLRLLALPEQLQQWIRGLIGRRRQVNVMRRMWRNVAGAAAGEARPDDPVLDALEERRARFARAREALTDPARAAFVFVVTPERLPILETERATRILERYRIPVGAVVVNRVLPADAAGAFAARRRDGEARYLDDLRHRFAAHPLLGVPQLPNEPHGVDDLRRVWEELRSAARR